MKWILIAILIVVIMIIAKSFTNQYVEKYDFYFNLKSFLIQFKLNLSFKKDKINEFLNSVKTKKQFEKFKVAYINYLDSGQLDLSEINVMDFEEKNQLEEMILSIGRYDAKSEIMQLETFISEIDEKVKISNENKLKLCPLILKLSLLFAIGVAIILL